MKAALEKAQAAQEPNAAEVARLQEKVNILEVQSEINLPSVRWKARNGLGTHTRGYIYYSMYSAKCSRYDQARIPSPH